MNKSNDEFEIKSAYPIINAIFDDIEQHILAPLSYLREGETEWVLEFDLPMVEKNDIKISLYDENTITVEAKLRETYCDTNFINKTEFDSFKKTVSLPGTINAKKISAKFERGRLLVRIPKLLAGTSISIE